MKFYYDTDLYVANKKIKLLKSNSVLSTISTLWKGEIILCEFDHLRKEIKHVTAAQIFEPEDFVKLERVIIDFFDAGS